MNIVDKKKNKWLELLRFAVCGLVSALIDYIICQLIVLAFSNTGVDKFVITAISTATGFIVSVIVNYLISTFWVYQNVKDEKAAKTPKFILFFILLSIGALILSVGAMEICNLLTEAIWHFNVVDDSIMELIKNFGWGFLKEQVFWAYIVSFGIKTLVGLVFNYFTRKYILYKAPKE